MSESVARTAGLTKRVPSSARRHAGENPLRKEATLVIEFNRDFDPETGDTLGGRDRLVTITSPNQKELIQEMFKTAALVSVVVRTPDGELVENAQHKPRKALQRLKAGA